MLRTSSLEKHVSIIYFPLNSFLVVSLCLGIRHRLDMDDTVKTFKKEKKVAAKGGNVKITSSEEVKGLAVKSNKSRCQDGNNDKFRPKSSSSYPVFKKGYKRPLTSCSKLSPTTDKEHHLKPTADKLSKLAPITNNGCGLNAPGNIEKLKRKRLDSWCTKSAKSKG